MPTNSLPISAIESFRDGSINSNPALAMELYEYVVRASDSAWTNHFKNSANDWHSSGVIREDFNTTLLAFLLGRKADYTLADYGIACSIVSPATYHSPAMAHWVWKRKVPSTITLLTAKYVGVDYIGLYPINVAVTLPRSLELHKATVWLRKKFADDCVDLYSLDNSTHYMPELLQVLGHSKIGYVKRRRAAAAEDAMHVLSNRFPTYLGNIT